MAKITLDSRQVGGGAVVLLGVCALLSGALINPVVGQWTKGPRIVDYADVLGGYFVWSMVLGVALVALGFRLARGASRLDYFAVLIVLVAGTILFDRFLLSRFGLAIWTYDTEIWYRHRPNIVRTLAGAGRPQSHIVINRWGFHDTDFSLEKPKGEFRALALGDSITMGYGLTYAETYSAHLEAMLGGRDRKHVSHQVINTGVHGYSTYQQKRVLERALGFAPDVVFLGFCMNDVTEPFVLDRNFGGTGIDYHNVVQVTNPIAGWLANETGIGRLAQVFETHGKSQAAEKRLEVYNVRKMAAESRTSPQLREAWQIVLRQLSEIYALAGQHRIPVVLVIFPYTAQLADTSLRVPQEILAEHASKHNVHVIDMTDDFAQAVFDDPQLVAYLRRKGKSSDEILAYHQFRVDQFFFDVNHFTSAGNRIVAQRLLDYLQQNGLVSAAGVRARP